MSTAQLRDQAKKTIDGLSGTRLRFATSFLELIRQRKIDAATRELLEIRGFAESFRRGLSDVRAGRMKDWREVRRNV